LTPRRADLPIATGDVTSEYRVVHRDGVAVPHDHELGDMMAHASKIVASRSMQTTLRIKPSPGLRATETRSHGGIFEPAGWGGVTAPGGAATSF
jgi:hypothetical protein